MGVPAAGVSAVAVNLTVTEPNGGGYVTGYAGGTTRPGVSQVNFAAGATRAGFAFLPVGVDGTIELYVSTATHLLADIRGWVSTPSTASGTAGRFRAVPATRLLDTRTSSTTPSPGPGQTVTLRLSAPIPPDAGAVVLNVTAAAPTTRGHLTVYPAGETRPTASTVNFAAGEVVANRVVVPVGADGSIAVSNSSGTTGLIVDTVGYLTGEGSATNDGAGWFVPFTGERLLDTRAGEPLTAGAVRDVVVGAAAGVPQVYGPALALSGTTVGLEATRGGYLTVYPGYRDRPATSDLNTVPGLTVSNAVVVAQESLRVRIFNYTGRTDVIFDVTGLFSCGAYCWSNPTALAE